ncbi:MAG: hypothetical protein NVS4B2_23690 [Chloroflexota bacterium]
MNVSLGIPLMRMEMRAQMRGWQGFALLTFNLCVLAIVEGAFLLHDSGPVADNAVPVGVQLFHRLAGAQLALIFVMVPCVMAGTVSGERRRGTWDLLMLTPISSFGVVLSKVGARVLFLLLLLVSALPLMSISFLYGDLSVTDVGPACVVLVSTLLLICAVTVLFSTVTRHLAIAAACGLLASALLGIGLSAAVSSQGGGAWNPVDVSTAPPATILATMSPVVALDSALPSTSIPVTVKHPFGLPLESRLWLPYTCIALALSFVLLFASVIHIRWRASIRWPRRARST